MRDYAAERLQQGGWEVFAEIAPPDPQVQAKFVAANRIIHATFTSPAGRQTLDWMIGNFLLAQNPPGDDTTAAFKLGQESVVKQILYAMKQTQEGE